MIADNSRVAGPYNTNGATTDFAFDFKVMQPSDLRVYARADAIDVLVDSGDYTITLNGDQDNDPGGFVTLAPALNGPQVLITSETEVAQPAAFTNQGGFYPRVLNDALDRVTIFAQELRAKLGRTLQAPLGDEPPAFPSMTGSEGKVLASVAGGVLAWLDSTAFRGPRGYPGGSENTYVGYSGLADLKASDVLRAKASVSGVPGLADGDFFWTSGDYTGKADDRLVIASDDVPLSAGAWVRQGASAVAKTDSPYAETLGTFLRRVPVTPEEYGAHVDDDDCSAQVANAFAAGADEGREVTGQNRTYRWKDADVPSGSFIRDIRALVPASTVDCAPFFINGQASVREDIRLENIHVDGNRANQTNMTSSGGDGQRAGIKIFGETRNVRLVKPVVTHCATDGIFVWHGSVEPASGTDYCHVDLTIEDPEVSWSGRHGISLSSVKNARIAAPGRRGILTKNGMDLPGASGGSYTDGKYGRKFAGSLYGRGATFESYLNGDGFDTLELIGLDCRGNVSGVLIMHRTHGTPCFNFRAADCLFDDPQGGVGDGAFVTYAVDDATNLPYTGADGFVGFTMTANQHFRNAPFLRNIKGLAVADTLSIVDPDVSVYGFNIDAATVEDVYYFACPANRAISGLVAPIAVEGVTQFLGSDWTATPGELKFEGFTPLGAAQLHLRLTVTADATEAGGFDVELPAGWSNITNVRANMTNNTVGTPATVSAFRSGNEPSAVSFLINGAVSTEYLVDLYFTVAKA